MTRPTMIKSRPAIHALVDQILDELVDDTSAMGVALHLLERESGSWLLFMRLGDDDPPRPDGRRLFGMLRHKDLGDQADDKRVRETVTSWLAGKS